ncbi:MAG: SagB/ThcOx family dehydrogenase [Bacilli bacterium]|nr:SagB/ThcOx family dehydrogenase [Bacilli bacterium]
MSKNRNTSPLFYVYWDNSKLNEKNIIKYINDFSYEENDIRKIEYPTNDLKLVYPKDNLYKLMKKRQSSRLYNDYQLNVKQLSSLFSCFTQVDNHRLLSSAGGKYPIEVYALCFNVKNFNNKIVYYNYSDNSLSIIGNCQDWDSLKSITGVGDAITGRPSIMFVFVGFPDRVVSKYGERGGRFLLIESGHYIQNLLLRITYEKLKAVELGGLFDDDIKNILGLKNTNAIITLGVICGK